MADFTDINLTTFIIEESVLLSSLDINKNIEIAFNETQITPIKGNDPSLRLLIRNLLTSAISYTPSGGNISINLSQKEQHTVLIIEDNGPGISEEDRKRVMERFYRAQNHRVAGCGTGLSIVDRVVQMHRGSLQLCQADGGQDLKVIIQF